MADYNSIHSGADVDDGVLKKHQHSNKDILDGTEQSFKTSHKNKLDNIGITTHLDLDSMSNDSHIHSNKDVLDQTEQPFTTVLKDKLDAVDVTAKNLTNEDVKTKYEANTDTNAFTDNHKSKLESLPIDAEPNVVNSVQGRTGDVVISANDIDLGQVDNTRDVDKPISGATQVELDKKELLSNKGKPNGYAPLESNGKVSSEYLPATVTGVSDFLDLDDSPINYSGSSNKILKVNDTATGIIFEDETVLSDAEVKIAYENNADTNAYTDSEKVKLSNVPLNTNTELSTKVDKLNGSSLVEDTKIDSYDTHIANVENPHNVTSAQVGLGNVDNTSDVNKPVSVAQQTALDGKQEILTEGAFIDGDKTKLDNIETGATADQTKRYSN